MFRGGGRGGPPLEIEKQQKKTTIKKVVRANFKLFHLYFATFLVGSIIFTENIRRQLGSYTENTNLPFRFLPSPPPLRIPGHATRRGGVI